LGRWGVERTVQVGVQCSKGPQAEGCQPRGAWIRKKSHGSCAWLARRLPALHLRLQLWSCPAATVPTHPSSSQLRPPVASWRSGQSVTLASSEAAAHMPIFAAPAAGQAGKQAQLARRLPVPARRCRGVTLLLTAGTRMLSLQVSGVRRASGQQAGWQAQEREGTRSLTGRHETLAARRHSLARSPYPMGCCKASPTSALPGRPACPEEERARVR